MQWNPKDKVCEFWTGFLKDFIVKKSSCLVFFNIIIKFLQVKCTDIHVLNIDNKNWQSCENLKTEVVITFEYNSI